MDLLRIDALSSALRPTVDPLPALPSVPATSVDPSGTAASGLAQAPAGAAFQQVLQTAVQPEAVASLDVALENALRFGAGVGTQAALALQPTGMDLELIRDATAVLRARGLPPQGGESSAFLPSQPPFQGLPSAYAPLPVATVSNQLDLLA